MPLFNGKVWHTRDFYCQMRLKITPIDAEIWYKSASQVCVCDVVGALFSDETKIETLHC